MEPPIETARPAPVSPAGIAGPARFVVALAVVAALAALIWPRGEAPRERRPGGFLVDATGRPQPLSRELKPVTLVHFWATWCPPCLTEIPSLVAWGRAARSERFGVVLVAVDDDPEAARKFLGGADFPLLFDPDWDVAHRFGTDKLPESHLVVGGEVVDSFIGAADWSDPAVQARVQKWTASPPSARP